MPLSCLFASQSKDNLRYILVIYKTYLSDSITDKLVQRVKGGLGSQKYKAVNYDELKAMTLEKKIQGQEKLMKVKKLKEVSKQVT